MLPPGAIMRAAARGARARFAEVHRDQCTPREQSNVRRNGDDWRVCRSRHLQRSLLRLAAMSTRGAGGIARALLGSVATAVVRTSEVPVLLVTPNVPIPMLPRASRG